MKIKASQLRAGAISRCIVAGQRNEEGLGKLRVAAKLSCRLIAAYYRQADIMKYDVRHQLMSKRKPGRYVVGYRDLVPINPDENCQRISGVGVMVNDQDGFLRFEHGVKL